MYIFHQRSNEYFCPSVRHSLYTTAALKFVSLKKRVDIGSTDQLLCILRLFSIKKRFIFYIESFNSLGAFLVFNRLNLVLLCLDRLLRLFQFNRLNRNRLNR